MPDRIFADPRLARMYDPLDPDRSDLDAYLALVDELGASSVLDVGCGTGTFACLLAQQDVDVVGVDPAEASLDVARRKPGADRVRWLLGDATTLPALRVDLATMTGNVAQVLLGDDDLRSTLVGIGGALVPGGHVVFEVRDPGRQAWLSWTRELSWARTVVPDEGPVESWVEVTSVDLPFVSFRSVRRVEATGEVLTSDSTLRFRDRTEVERAIAGAGLDVVDVRDAPDRPGLEHVFLCAAPDRS